MFVSIKEYNLDLTIITTNDFIKGRHLKKVNYVINELGSINQSLDGFG